LVTHLHIDEEQVEEVSKVFERSIPKVSISAGKVVIAGGSGFLGQALSASLLQDGYEVVILGRSNKAD
jgi:D-arabinose 5-phosphate isomerase GutQ